MSQTHYEDYDKSFIIDKAKELIRNSNEYTSIVHAINQTKLGKEFTDADHKREFIKAVAAQLTNSGKYLKEKNKTEDDYEIYKNPQYWQMLWTRGLSITALIVSIISIIIKTK